VKSYTFILGSALILIFYGLGIYLIYYEIYSSTFVYYSTGFSSNEESLWDYITGDAKEWLFEDPYEY